MGRGAADEEPRAHSRLVLISEQLYFIFPGDMFALQMESRAQFFLIWYLVLN
jgi:hypothetical protein